MAYVPRQLARTLARGLRTFPAALVTGPRQAGKTTLLREELAGSHRLVSLERPDVRARAVADPIGFFADHPPPIILDEIQHAPTLLPYIKDLIDEDRAPGRWVLTGSQSLALMRDVSESLAGRVAVLRLDPLSTSEVARAPRRDLDELIAHVFAGRPSTRRRRPGTDLPDWLLRGGYPEVRLDRRVDRQLWFSSYVQTYLERDVRDLLKVADLDTFSRFLSLVAARTATIVNMTELAQQLGVAVPTVKRWLDVLEASQVVVLVRPFHDNLGKRISRSPKLYLIDPGLATFLMGLHAHEAIMNGPTVGALVETAVVGEWVKAFRARGEQPAIFHFRDNHGLEVDLVIERNRELFAIEVKATATPTPKHADAVRRFLALAGDRARGAVACRIDAPMALAPGVRAVPWHLAW